MFDIFASILLVFNFLATNVASSANIEAVSYDGILDTCGGGITSNPKPFVKIGLKYYIIEDRNKTNWYKAAHNCRELNAELANIESEAQMVALSNYLIETGRGDEWFWLSGNDLAEESKFYSLANGKPISYTRWHSGEPNNHGGNENCIQLRRYGGAFHMNDWSCNRVSKYICQANEPKTVVFTVW